MVLWKKKKKKEKKEEDEEVERGFGVEGKGYSTNGDYGIKTLADPRDAKIDIIFIHGLTGNRDSTWQDKKSGTIWPQDLLPGDMPKARVVTFGYDADVVGLIDVASSNTIRDHGKALATQVAQKRLLDGSVSFPKV
ncbi:MAG: hypothetical protein LQ344_006773 [Seirophora lacunosa]|nr:MAG: hypothetical protein LQ344_006773 [Seirophora lacunosa]